MEFLFLAFFLLVLFVVGGVAIFIDRSNFPQRPFRPKEVAEDTPTDYTGAHITIEE